MKFETAKVISHPRAGSHYLAWLLNNNFFHKNNYLELYAGHGKEHIKYLERKDTAVFYIHRDIKPTLASMYTLRDRLGLRCDSWEHFLSSKLKDLRCRKTIHRTCYDSGKDKTYVTDTDHYLGRFNLTPKEFLVGHKNYWTRIHSDNYMVISYGALINNFEKEMIVIAKFLGSDKKEFINIEHRIGWYIESI